MQVIILHAFGRSRADGGDPGASDLSQIVIQFEKNLEECVHSIWTRENDPVVAMRVPDQFGELAQISRRLDSNGRQFQDIGT